MADGVDMATQNLQALAAASQSLADGVHRPDEMTALAGQLFPSNFGESAQLVAWLQKVPTTLGDWTDGLATTELHNAAFMNNAAQSFRNLDGQRGDQLNRLADDLNRNAVRGPRKPPPPAGPTPPLQDSSGNPIQGPLPGPWQPDPSRADPGNGWLTRIATTGTGPV